MSSFQSACKHMWLSAEEKFHSTHQLFNAVLWSYLQVHLIYKGIQNILLKLGSKCKDQVLLLNPKKVCVLVSVTGI